MSRIKESAFQALLISKIQNEFPDAIVLKNDANYKPGIPDLLILNRRNWGALECKRDSKASHRPGQDYYVHKMHLMSFARFIYPENSEEVLNELYRRLSY